jgi:hypothetical protein
VFRLVFISKPIGEPIGVGALKPALLCVTGLLTTWVKSSTEAIVAIKTAAAINETTQTSLDPDHIQGFTHSTGLFLTPAVHKK